MVRVSKTVWDTFGFNLSRARALAQGQRYMEVLVKEGDAAVQSYLNTAIQKLFGLIGFNWKGMMETIMKQVEEPLTKEFQRQIEAVPKEEREKRMAQLAGVDEDHIPAELKPLVEPILALQFLSYQTLTEGAVVLAVASYEAFLKDVVAAEARRRPSVLNAFPVIHKEIDYRVIRQYGGKVRDAQAETLANSLDAYRTRAVRSYFKRIFGVENVFGSGKLERDIHRLVQIRNLIIHHGGVVNRQFKAATKWKQPLRERIEIPFATALRYIEAVRRFGLRVKEV